MRLLFQPERISRATTRAEWREMDRWRRVTQRALAAHEERIRRQLAHVHEDIAAFGSAGVLIRDDLTAQLINPPIMALP